MHSYPPLTEVTYYILLSLSPGAKHGYAIMKDVRSLSQGRVVLSTGTLYGALKRLLEQDSIRRTEEKQAEDNGRDRNVYILTRQGRGVLQAEVKRLDLLLHAAQLRSVEGSP